MRILLDHCIDWRLARSLPAHDVKNARDLGWEVLKNGALLSAAACQFDCVVTTDQNPKHQQNLATLPVTVVVLVTQRNRLADLIPLVPAPRGGTRVTGAQDVGRSALGAAVSTNPL